ncbi:MAG: alpha/beta hydrolase [Balneolaceae bacterium]|nr:alpha/beta hydrolase [Balneolaceae bacterium]MCH8547440.1 alpha/beta hydrolase [Balneolaceae bacterium]
MTYSTLDLNSGGKASIMDSGSSEETILMVHGNSLSKETFEAQLNSSLTDRFRIIAVDLPGHGENSKNSSNGENYSIKGLADFLTEVTATLQLEKVVIVGHSLGGHLAIQAAADIPALKGIIAIGTPPLTPKESELAPFLDHPSLPFAFTAELSDSQIEELAASYWNSSKSVPEIIIKSFGHTDPHFRSDMGADVAKGNLLDETEIIEKLPFQVALSVGEFDQLVNQNYIQKVVDEETIWKGGVQVISGCGHTPQMENPEACNSLIGAYAGEAFERD